MRVLSARSWPASAREIEQSRARVSERELEWRLARRRSGPRFRTPRLAAGSGVRLIAEVKKASPSAGVLRADFDPVAIARTYVAAGAAALSVLTDAALFPGPARIPSGHPRRVAVPILRKDFLLERYQLLEARAAGADAVLLIAEILDDSGVAAPHSEAAGAGSCMPWWNCTTRRTCRASGRRARIIGVNNRDLRTFQTTLEHTLELAPRVPPDCLLVSESGIRNRADILRLEAAGVHAVLIGETFMRAADLGAKVKELMHG